MDKARAGNVPEKSSLPGWGRDIDCMGIDLVACVVNRGEHVLRRANTSTVQMAPN